MGRHRKQGRKRQPDAGHAAATTSLTGTGPSRSATDSGAEEARNVEEDLRTQAALERYVTKSNAEIHGLFEILGRKRRLLAVNFLAGLSRGVGFFLGMTLIGGLVVGLIALTVDSTMRVLNVEDVTFKSLMEVMARRAVQAQRVWDDVIEEEEGRVAVEEAEDVLSSLVEEETAKLPSDDTPAAKDAAPTESPPPAAPQPTAPRPTSEDAADPPGAEDDG